MKQKPWLMAFSFILLAMTCACSSLPPADMLISGGTIYTLDPSQPQVEALAISKGRIVAAGSLSKLKGRIGPATTQLQLAGQTAFPGFIDAHMHLQGVGKSLTSLQLGDCESMGAMLRMLHVEDKKLAAGEWLIGRGWSETHWPENRFPTRYDLDAIGVQRPIALTRVDGHALVCNSIALKLAGVNAESKDPEGGQILRVPNGSEPNGMLLDKAMSLVRIHIPKDDPIKLRQQLLAGAKEYARRGWTAVQVAGGSWAQKQTIEALANEGLLPIRVSVAVSGPGSAAEKLFEQGASGTEDFGRVSSRCIKVFFDGALGSGGAALLEDYSDRPGRGHLLHAEEDLLKLFERALRTGIQIQVHAIGDRANRIALDLMEQSYELVPAEERVVLHPRWRIEHAQHVDAADAERFKTLEVIPSMQPSHAISDLHFAKDRLGEERLHEAYTWNRFVQLGCKIAGGSDAPIEKGDPILEFYAACFRQDPRKDPKGFSEESWRLEEKLGREEALKMFTEWAAYAVFQEKWKGRLEVGMAADITIFNRDLLKASQDSIMQTKCTKTIVAGEVVFDATQIRSN